MGSREISLEPAASCFGFRGLMTMKVSLCGPHSFETSTFAGVEPLVAAARNESGPCWARIWNLSHQVGSWLLLQQAPEGRWREQRPRCAHAWMPPGVGSYTFLSEAAARVTIGRSRGGERIERRVIGIVRVESSFPSSGFRADPTIGLITPQPARL